MTESRLLELEYLAAGCKDGPGWEATLAAALSECLVNLRAAAKHLSNKQNYPPLPGSKVCLFCGNEYMVSNLKDGRSKRSKFCSDICRVNNYRKELAASTNDTTPA